MIDQGEFYPFNRNVRILESNGYSIYCAIFVHVLNREYYPIFFVKENNKLYFIFSSNNLHSKTEEGAVHLFDEIKKCEYILIVKEENTCTGVQIIIRVKELYKIEQYLCGYPYYKYTLMSPVLESPFTKTGEPVSPFTYYEQQLCASFVNI